ncbi:hypothetical protein U879_13610 [Defluviimonas sp. 20V17]|uniref:Uncharacterized protein n=1 Tax=Allgaiera indica TaxID=765699 RepID=A0AAN4UQ70_9RHOB|nr:hypothetical protein [Allgaiera indica]KDB03146.1 hypothetical protein U879_13610 [Defluviimonas sp. 20V17]GHE00908.1 hypothetical protein GCM10008024_14420 [Allgaiera indica]SDW74260.1 hypothetical protein SAMN05444006_106133 [Allgaiera indica]
MRQSHRLFTLKAAANVAVGYGVTALLQLALFPVAGLSLPLVQSLKLDLAFTLAWLARIYVLRRAFARWGRESRRATTSQPDLAGGA